LWFGFALGQSQDQAISHLKRRQPKRPTQPNPSPHKNRNTEPPFGDKSAVKFRMVHTKRMGALDKAAIKKDDDAELPAADGAEITKGKKQPYQVSMTEVEETKSFLYIMPIFLCVVIWQVRGRKGGGCAWSPLWR